MTDQPQTRPSTAPAYQPTRLRKQLALGAALLAGATVVALRHFNLLNGAPAILLGAALLLLTPTFKSVCPRIAANLLAGIAGSGLLYILPDAFGDVGRATVCYGVATAAVALVAVRNGPRSLLPRIVRLDALLLLSTTFLAFVNTPWLSVNSRLQAMQLFSEGWDYSSHVNIIAQIYRYGQIITLLPTTPENHHWLFSDYPQSFNASVSFLVESLIGVQHTMGPADLLVPVAHAIGLMMIALGTMVVAAILSVRSVRKHPFACVVPLAALLAATGWGPIDSLLRQGFVNHLAALQISAATLLLAGNTRRPVTLASIVPITLGIIVVLNSWLPLAVLALPAFLVILSAPPKRSGMGWKRHLSYLAVSAAVICGAGVWTLATISGQAVTIAQNVVIGANAEDLGFEFISILTVLGVAVIGVSLSGWSALLTEFRVETAYALSALTTLTFALWQTISAGDFGYYSIKLTQGVGLAGLIILPTTIARVFNAAKVRKPRLVVLAGSATALLALAAFQLFGITIPQSYSTTLPSFSFENPLRPVPDATGDVADALHAGELAYALGPDVTYVNLRPDNWYVLYNIWALTVAGARDDYADLFRGEFAPALTTVDDAARATRSLLEHFPERYVVLQPQYYPEVMSLLSDLPAPELSRVVTW